MQGVSSNHFLVPYSNQTANNHPSTRDQHSSSSVQSLGLGVPPSLSPVIQQHIDRIALFIERPLSQSFGLKHYQLEQAVKQYLGSPGALTREQISVLAENKLITGADLKALDDFGKFRNDARQAASAIVLGAVTLAVTYAVLEHTGAPLHLTIAVAMLGAYLTLFHQYHGGHGTGDQEGTAGRLVRDFHGSVAGVGTLPLRADDLQKEIDAFKHYRELVKAPLVGKPLAHLSEIGRRANECLQGIVRLADPRGWQRLSVHAATGAVFAILNKALEIEKLVSIPSAGQNLKLCADTYANAPANSTQKTTALAGIKQVISDAGSSLTSRELYDTIKPFLEQSLHRNVLSDDCKSLVESMKPGQWAALSEEVASGRLPLAPPMQAALLTAMQHWISHHKAGFMEAEHMNALLPWLSRFGQLDAAVRSTLSAAIESIVMDPVWSPPYAAELVDRMHFSANTFPDAATAFQDGSRQRIETAYTVRTALAGREWSELSPRELYEIVAPFLMQGAGTGHISAQCRQVMAEWKPEQWMALASEIASGRLPVSADMQVRLLVALGALIKEGDFKPTEQEFGAIVQQWLSGDGTSDRTVRMLLGSTIMSVAASHGWQNQWGFGMRLNTDLLQNTITLSLNQSTGNTP